MTIKNTGSSNARLDNILLKVTTAGSSSEKEDCDLALTGDPVALSFDLNGNASAQVINYTTSSTGAVTVSSSDYITAVVDETAKTITVTPTAKTPSTQTITVTQAADDTYKLGTATFTVTITDSTPVPTHTATFSVNGTTSAQDFEEGAAIVFPTNIADVYGKSFVGWVAAAIDGTTDDAPEFVTSATMGESDVTYYAVFATTGDSYSDTETEITQTLSYDTWTYYGDTFDKDTYRVFCKDSYIESAVFDLSLLKQVNVYGGGSFGTIPSGQSKHFTIKGGGTTWAERTTTGTSQTNKLELTSDVSLTGNGTVQVVSDCGKSNSSGLRISKVEILTKKKVTSYSDYCTTVAAPIAVTGVTLDKNTATLEVGETETLTATIAPNDATNKNVTWTSSDEGVATVENGVVTAVGVGSATITATSAADNTKTATCTVTVNPTAVTGVSVDATATVKTGKTKTLTATVSPDNATNKNVTWTSSDTGIATVSSEGVVTGEAVGTATITVTSVADNTKSASCTVTVLAAGEGTKTNPYDVAEAIEKIDGGSGTDLTGKYVKGIIAKIDRVTADGNAQYWISDDGVTTNQFEVYNGYYYGGENFSSSDDIKVGDEVVVYGTLYYYSKNSVNEFAAGNYIYSLNGVKIPEITFGATSYEVAYNGSLTITATADCSGAITYASSDEAIAEINSTTGAVTPHKTGEVTITANIAASSDNIAGSKTVTLTVTDGRESAGIEFAQATVTTTWGESFTGQTLTNNNGLAVSYASSVPDVATVDTGTGAVSVLKSGTTVITATFAGDEDYMPAEVSYTLTVNKAEAGLSFDETEFDIEQGDDSFVAPTLNNPNSLTVNWESSDEDVAVILDGNGTLMYEENAVGTATITASFAGNDWYNAGNASYTINIYDPYAKGTKNNPYTVAEVNTGSYSGNNYVIGYIVGYFNGSASDATTTGTENTVANVALSDSPSEIGGANTIAIQLPSGDIRNAWNIYNNAVIGYKVLVYGNITGYFTSKTGVKNTSEITAVSVPAEVSAADYATFVAKAAVDFSDSNIKAYIAEAKDGATGVTFTRMYKIPANTGVLLYKEGGATEEIPVTTESTDYVASNVFAPGTGAAVASETQETVNDEQHTFHNYILNNIGGVVGFYKANGQMVAKNRAYIRIDTNIWGGSSNNIKEFITLPGFEDDATGIKEEIRMKSEESAIYNVAGQRINKLQKGINIVNGKKVLF